MLAKMKETPDNEMVTDFAREIRIRNLQDHPVKGGFMRIQALKERLTPDAQLTNDTQIQARIDLLSHEEPSPANDLRLAALMDMMRQPQQATAVWVKKGEEAYKVCPQFANV